MQMYELLMNLDQSKFEKMCTAKVHHTRSSLEENLFDLSPQCSHVSNGKMQPYAPPKDA